MKIMICGSIGYGGLNEIKETQSILRENGFVVVDHIFEENTDFSHIRDFRDRKELASKIVEHDLNHIQHCDIVVVLLDRPSYGAAVEMFVAKKTGKTVISLCKKPIPTPWPVFLSDTLVADEKELISALTKLTGKQ